MSAGRFHFVDILFWRMLWQDRMTLLWFCIGVCAAHVTLCVDAAVQQLDSLNVCTLQHLHSASEKATSVIFL